MTGPGAEIRFICDAHTQGVPVITLNEGQWAYCPGGDVGPLRSHSWTPIPAVHVSQLKGKQVGLVRERALIGERP